MASRLDRLFVLLETGSNAGTRKAAAQQLGQVQRLHPHELPYLLQRVQKCLSSASWETRIAAGQAVEAILSQLPPWTPYEEVDVKIKEEVSDNDQVPITVTPVSSSHQLKFSSFDVDNLIRSSGSQLLTASEGKAFDRETGDASNSEKQRTRLNKSLGLDLAEKIGIDTSEIVSAEDLVHVRSMDLARSQSFPGTGEVEPNLSSREINLAKRRARKQRSKEATELAEREQQQSSSSNKKLKREDSTWSESTFGIGVDMNFYEKAKEEGRWPLEDWVQLLVQDLFSPSWELRHGSGIALRVIARLHGHSAGKRSQVSENENKELHQAWLEDISLRLVSVLILDRFGDFVEDQVVAPVRETCAQCVGTLLTLMTPPKVKSLLQVLIQLLAQKPWEVRHGGLLGLKYLFAVRTDLVEELLPLAFPSVFASLQDAVDDVSAVAAAALVPVTKELVNALPNEAPNVVSVLWESLASLDDLSSACNSIMSLLASLLAFPVARNQLRKMDLLMPRLWPFLHHTSSSVRKSSLLTLQKLTELDSTVTPMSIHPLQLTLRHTFQRALLEHIPEVLELIPPAWSDILKSSDLDTLLQATCPMLGNWLFLAMHHPKVPIDPQNLLPISKHHIRGEGAGETDGVERVYISGSGDANPLRVANTRLSLAKMLGHLTPYIVQPLPEGMPGEQPIECFVRVILYYLNTRSALQRTVAALVLSAWEKKTLPNVNGADESRNGCSTAMNGSHTSSQNACHPGLEKRLLECLTEPIYFDEVTYGFTKLQSECRDFIATLKHYQVPPAPVWDFQGMFSFDQIQAISDESLIEVIQKHVKKSKIQESLLERRKCIANLYVATRTEFTSLSTMTLGSLAGAVVSLNCLPDRLNPVVKPLMESIRKEENELFQNRAALHLCHLMNLVLDRNPCPNSKIIQNLILFLCGIGDFTPPYEEGPGILSLAQLNAGSTTGNKKLEDTAVTEEKKSLLIQRRGATSALGQIASFFGVDLPTKVGKLWELTFGVLQTASVDESREDELRKVLDALQVLETISSKFHLSLFVEIENQISRICELLGHKSGAIRHMASRCLSTWAFLIPEKVIPVVTKEVIPRLGGIESVILRQGAIECLWCIVDQMGLDLLPYIVLLVVPVLGRMSDQDEAVRQLASLTFATLVRLMPLEGSCPDPPDLPKELVTQKKEQRDFLEQLLNPTVIPEYKISVPIKAELRPYQQAGVNWLGFLNKYKLHGILCDDMGLGKTLQSICILGSDHYNRAEAYKMAANPDSAPLPSIVVCPPTLTGHWVYEIETFIDKMYLNPLHYHGPPTERTKLQSLISKHNLVVASYDIVRNDVEFFGAIHWNYCILDEGHMIKNGKTKISRAIKQIKANHRLILSGTPIQNNVLELWSLFDFLMPGFLGSEKQFSTRFGRPILLARDPKSSPKDQEGGALAMEALHRQALPFLLRRLKEDVLKDLPPKITQDYYCDLSTIQEQLYEDFARTRAHQSLRDTFSGSDDSHKHTHIFQALQYLRKVCNHPKLVLSPQHPKYSSIMTHLSQTKSSLNDIKHSTKLPALKQLLLDCGIGVTDSSNGTDSIDVVNQHRALIFCQLKVMLDILENDLFKGHMPSVTYLRLDGSVPAGQRHSLVTRFNNDPSIDVLLLTTQVGGLGLNLTGADTVIFVEHDWNPWRDLQAMDRAHRIGQKKVVNVYRLITRGTLEEKIMGLQKFKLLTANTVISQDNSCIETMATDQLLDLFVLEDSKEKGGKKREEDVGGIVGGYKSLIENIPDLWDDKAYDEEYDLSTFIKNLAK